MNYQLTLLTENPGATLALMGRDGSFWCLAGTSLYLFDGCAWQPFAIMTGGACAVAVDRLDNIWSIGVTDTGASDKTIYNFNGIGWAPKSLDHGGAQSLSVGFDGEAWCLDDANQVWRFDSASDKWKRFGHPSGSDPVLAQISSGGTVKGGIALAALDGAGLAWRCTNAAGTWKPIPNANQVHGQSIAVAPDGTVYIVDVPPTKALWKWSDGDPGWTQISDSNMAGFISVSVQGDGKLLAVSGNSLAKGNPIYSGAAKYPSLMGFRGSDWNNAGTEIFAVRRDDTAGCDQIFRSSDGVTFETEPCASLPPIAAGGIYYYTIALMIPTATGGGPESMLVAPIGLQSIYLCSDISQAQLQFTPVPTGTSNPGTAGVFNGFAEDTDGNVYAGWYAINTDENQAILYWSTPTEKPADRYKSWTVRKSWAARHIHTVRVNPHNGYLYVVLGEPTSSDAVSTSADVARIMRSKDNGATWTCLTDTWPNTPIMPSVPGAPTEYLGLYFAGLGFIKDRVVIGEDTDYKCGRIFYFDDDGREEGDPERPLPFLPQPTYKTCSNGEFFFNAVSFGDRLYFSSLYLDMSRIVGISSTRCVSTADGVTWRLEQVCDYTTSFQFYNAAFGIFTQHPERGGALIYSLSGGNSFLVEGIPDEPATEDCTDDDAAEEHKSAALAWARRNIFLILAFLALVLVAIAAAELS